MGNDGGDKPGRKQLVKDPPKKPKDDQQLIAYTKSRFCNLTKQRLKKPLAIDKLGLLYNYESLLQAFLNKTISDTCPHIKSLKDIKKVNIQLVEEGQDKVIVCPISNLHYNGHNKFYVNWQCGCIVSEKALNQIKVWNKCIICDKEYNPKKLIPINLNKQQSKQLMMKIRKKQGVFDEKEEPVPRKIPKIEPNVIGSKLEGNSKIKQIIRGSDTYLKLFHKQDFPGFQLFFRNNRIN